MIAVKKLASAFAAGALIVSAFTPAAFADDNHESHVNYTSSYSSSNQNIFGFHSHKLFASLNGENEVPGPGDPNGFGISRVNVDHEKGEVCVNIRVINIAPATAAHIHKGEVGVAGPVVVPLPTPDARGRVSGCVSVSTDLAEDIVDNPGEYYVNVHNTEYPNGAIRGQL